MTIPIEISAERQVTIDWRPVRDNAEFDMLLKNTLAEGPAQKLHALSSGLNMLADPGYDASRSQLIEILEGADRSLLDQLQNLKNLFELHDRDPQASLPISQRYKDLPTIELDLLPKPQISGKA